jgi:pimeloyl-ACP methyl ester carboxylesterase
MRRKWPFWLAALLIIVYFLGPHPSKPKYIRELPGVPSQPMALGQYVYAKESEHKLKPDNEARIIWFSDSSRQKTPYAFVYLHGFSASQKEGDPVHRNIAREFGANLYLSRLAEHGIDTSEQLLNLTADEYWASAEEALAIGKRLGEKVILMSTSTGGTLALKLAATYPDDIAGLILLSPNIAINDPFAWMLNNPWGLQIARAVKHGNYIVAEDDRPVYRQYWNKPYRLEAAVQLQELIATSMNKETFRRVKQPVQLIYYYKDEIHQDSVVKVSAMLTMFDELGTPYCLKRKMAMPGAGNHVVASPIKSHDVEGVQKEIERFLVEIMGLKPVGKSKL